MDRIKKLLLKKEKGNVGFYIVVMILFIIIAFIAVYELSFQRTIHLKTKVDNGIMLSICISMHQLVMLLMLQVLRLAIIYMLMLQDIHSADIPMCMKLIKVQEEWLFHVFWIP